MSLFNLIEKIKYTENLSDVVSLDEYIVFADERAERKYIVFKFTNNVNQQLLGMKFEVSQYDLDDKLIERTVVIYNDFLAKANSQFVPKARLKVLYPCRRISVRLIQAAFDRVLWNEGEYVDNSYKFEHYVRDQEQIEGKYQPEEKGGKTTKATQEEPQSYIADSRDNAPFTLKNITRKNVAKFPKVLYVFTCILSVLYVIISLFYFMLKTDKFTIQGYNLRHLGENTVSIYGYSGAETQLNVPDMIGDYTVIRVEKGAFRGSNVTQIHFASEVISITEYAFVDCKSLVSVTASGAITVLPYAFTGCENIRTIKMTNGDLAKNSFNGCVNVSELNFNKTDADKLVEIFGEEQHSVRITNFSCNGSLPAKFFDGANVKR